MGRDVTERRQAEEAIQRSEQIARAQTAIITATLQSITREPTPDSFTGQVLRTIVEQLGGIAGTFWVPADAPGSVRVYLDLEDDRLVKAEDSDHPGRSPSAHHRSAAPAAGTDRRPQGVRLRLHQHSPGLRTVPGMGVSPRSAHGAASADGVRIGYRGRLHGALRSRAQLRRAGPAARQGARAAGHARHPAHSARRAGEERRGGAGAGTGSARARRRAQPHQRGTPAHAGQAGDGRGPRAPARAHPAGSRRHRGRGHGLHLPVRGGERQPAAELVRAGRAAARSGARPALRRIGCTGCRGHLPGLAPGRGKRDARLVPVRGRRRSHPAPRAGLAARDADTAPSWPFRCWPASGRWASSACSSTIPSIRRSSISSWPGCSATRPGWRCSSPGWASAPSRQR